MDKKKLDDFVKKVEDLIRKREKNILDSLNVDFNYVCL